MTAADHTRYSEWDAAYVLGALPAERLEFEDHLDTCEKCRAAVAELSGLPGLLGRLDHARAYALLEQEESGDEPGDEDLDGPELPEAPAAPVDLVARIRSRERAQKLRRRLGSVAGLAAAAVLASVLTIVVPQVVAPAARPDVTSFLQPVADGAPIDAIATLTQVGWGTRIDLECSYHPGAGGYGAVAYSMWVVGRDGTESAVSSWLAAPESTVKLSSGTALSLTDIKNVQLRSADGSQTLLSSDVDYRPAAAG